MAELGLCFYVRGVLCLVQLCQVFLFRLSGCGDEGGLVQLVDSSQVHDAGIAGTADDFLATQ